MDPQETQQTRPTRQIIVTSLLRLCAPELNAPELNATSGELRTDLGYDVGLRVGNQKLSLLADIDRPPRSPRYRVNLLKGMHELDPGRFVEVYTCGSFHRREKRSGYGVHWPEQEQYGSWGPVTLPGESSRKKAGAYAILVALFEILAVDLTGGNVENKFCVYSGCQTAIDGIVHWLEWWQDPASLAALRTQPATANELDEIYRVAAGLLWELRSLGVCVILTYMRAHNGEPGYEVADVMAQAGCLSQEYFKAVPYFDETNDEPVNEEARNTVP